MATEFSKQGSLNLKDWIKTAIVTVGTGLLSSAASLLQSGSTLNWQTFKPAVLSSAYAGLAYVLKQLFTNSDGQLGRENN